MRAATGDIETAWFEVGRGEPIVLIHGLADDHRAWRKVLPPLMMTNRVVLYDLRGHGESTLGEANGTLRQLSGDLVALLDSLSIERTLLGGFSLGGTVAMRTAIDHPDRVAALGLISTSSRVGAAAAEWYRERERMVREGDPELRSTLDADTRDVYRMAPEEVTEGLTIRRQSTADPRGFANACHAMASLREHPLDPELGAILAPTAIVTGEDDQHCPPKAAHIIASGIPQASIETLPGRGHALPIEEPEKVAAVLGGLSVMSQRYPSA